jgi:hypothetical protein
MVPLSAGNAAVLPLAGEAEVIRGLAANVVVAEMVVECLRVAIRSRTLLPPTWERVGALGLPARCVGRAVERPCRRGSRRGHGAGWRRRVWNTGRVLERGMVHDGRDGEELGVEG